MTRPDPRLVWGSLLLWSSLGLVAALQVWTRPGMQLGLPFLALLHVPHWLAWAALSLVVWAAHLRFASHSWRMLLPLHLGLGAAVIAGHAAMVAGWDVLLLGDRFSLSWIQVFSNHLHSSAATEALGYVVMVGGAMLYQARRVKPQAPASIPSPLSVRLGNEYIVVELGEIRFVQAANNYSRVHTETQRLPVRQSLSAFARELPGTFVRVHRSLLVNPDHVARLRSAGRWQKFVVLKDGTELPASAEGWKRIREVVAPGADPPLRG